MDLMTTFLAGWAAARDEGEVRGYVLVYLADDGTHFCSAPDQEPPVSLGLATFADAWVRDDLQREFDKLD